MVILVVVCVILVGGVMLLARLGGKSLDEQIRTGVYRDEKSRDRALRRVNRANRARTARRTAKPVRVGVSVGLNGKPRVYASRRL